MNARTTDGYLRWAVRLFMLIATVVFLAGIGLPVVFRVAGRRGSGFVDFLILSDTADEGILGKTPADVVAAEPGVVDMQLFYLDLAFTLVLALAVLVAFVTWCGLRTGHRWAWWALLAGFGVTIVSLARVMVPLYLRAPFGLADVPPIMWVLLVAPVPLTLGWLGTKDVPPMKQRSHLEPEQHGPEARP